MSHQLVTTIIGYPLLFFLVGRIGYYLGAAIYESGGFRRLPLNLLKLFGIGLGFIIMLMFIFNLWQPLLFAWLLGLTR